MSIKEILGFMCIIWFLDKLRPLAFKWYKEHKYFKEQLLQDNAEIFKAVKDSNKS